MNRAFPPLLTLLLGACGDSTTTALHSDSGSGPSDTAVDSVSSHTHTGHEVPPTYMPETWFPRPSDTAATGRNDTHTGGRLIPPTYMPHTDPTDTGDTVTWCLDSLGCDSGETATAAYVPWPDTAAWPDTDACDSADTATGPCSYVLEIVADSDYADMLVELYDSSGNLILDVQAGELTAEGTYYFPVTLPTDGYHLYMEDTHNLSMAWGSNASVRLIPSSGGCLHEADGHGPYTVSQFGYQNEYLIAECDDQDTVWMDTGAAWCPPILDSADTATGDCLYILQVRSGYDHADMQITIEDSDGNLVFEIAAGDLTSESTFYYPVNLPTDGYTITWSDESTTSDNWDSDAFFQLLPAEGANECMQEGDGVTAAYDLPTGYGGERTEYLALNCDGDTADTNDTEGFLWLLAWCEPVLDSGEIPTGACPYVLEVRADYDYADMVIELSDSDGNLLVDVQQNDLTSSGTHYFPVNLRTDGYHLHLEDASTWSTSWGSNAYVRLIPADGQCIEEDEALESYTVTQFGELDEYFVHNCADDTSDTWFTWDSGWCEPILDSGEIPTGDCPYVLEVAADYDYAYMAINLTDADGNEILDIAAGDLTAEDLSYYPINLPTNGYTLTLLDDNPWGTSQWGPDAHVRLIPVEDGCFDPDVQAEEWRVDFNGEEIVHFEVDCADDSATFAWDSGWCDVILPDTAALTGCEQLIEVSTYYGYQMGIEIADSSGNVIFDIDYNDLGYYTAYFYTLDMPTGGYQLTLTDDGGNGWADYGTYAPGSLTIWEGNGVCAGEEALFGPYILPDTNGPTDFADNEVTMNLWVDCDADTSTAAVDTTWMGESGWTPPAPPADTETGDSTPAP